MPGIGLDTAPPELSAFLAATVADLRATMGDDLVAVILHGSLAMGSFHPPKSDIDLLVVTARADTAERQPLYDSLARAYAARPYVGGVEASVVRLADLAQPRHPLPYVVHLGDNTRGPQPLQNGALPTDPDLAAHLMVAKTRGVSLYGPPPAELIGPLSWADYLAAVRYDIDELMTDEALNASPRYAVLNLCRWAMMQLEGGHLVPSKDEGGVWALQHAPPDAQPAIAQALAAYRSDAPVAPADLAQAGGPWNPAEVQAVRDWVRRLDGG